VRVRQHNAHSTITGIRFCFLFAGTSSTLLAPMGWGVAGGLLLLVVVLVTVIVCLLIRQRRGAPAVLKGQCMACS